MCNGRSSYMIFEELVSILTGFERNSQAQGSDFSYAGKGYEQKSFANLFALKKDKGKIVPRYKTESGYKNQKFHTAASCCATANNVGKDTIRPLLKEGKYQEALDICKETGYNHNDYYVYTNTGGFDPLKSAFSYVIVPKEFVLQNLDKKDPRKISLKCILDSVVETVDIEGY